MDNLTQEKTIDASRTVSNSTRELLTSDAWKYMSNSPLFEKTLKFISIHLASTERQNGPSLEQCNDYFHAVRTAKIAYDLGFDDRVLFISLLHDFINPKHTMEGDRIWHLTDLLYQVDLSSVGMTPDAVIDSLVKVEDVERLSKDKTRNVPIQTVAGLFIHQKVEDPQEYEKVIEKYGVLPFLVNVCEAIDNLQYPKPSDTYRPHDLIEESVNIFEPDLERINELRKDRMIDDVVRIFRYYLPLLEASGHTEAIREIKDRAVQILAPMCFDRVSQSMNEIEQAHKPKVQEIFKHLTAVALHGSEKKLGRRKIHVVQPFLKGTGSTVIKMLLYGQEKPELGAALSKARGEEEIDVAISNILIEMRDLIRCRMVLPEDNRAELGSVFIPAVSKVVREITKTRDNIGIGFSKIDLDAGEAVQVYMKHERIVHAKRLITDLNGHASGLTIKSKLNGYEGTNIAVCYSGDHRFELQMLTSEMAYHNEYGNASHAGFKAGMTAEQVKRHSASVQEYMRR